MPSQTRARDVPDAALGGPALVPTAVHEIVASSRAGPGSHAEPQSDDAPLATTPQSVPESATPLSSQALDNILTVADWVTGEHPCAPRTFSRCGSTNLLDCGYCHVVG